MIVRPRSLALGIDAFLSQLAAARDASVLWLSDGRPVATAWHVSPSIVVVPSFVLRAQRPPYAARGFRDGEAALDADGAPVEDTEATAFELARPRSTPAMSLAMRSVVVGDDVVLVHVDVRAQALALSLGRVTAVREDRFDHDASSMFGSAGGALLNCDGQVVGLHLRTNASGANHALSTAKIVGDLRRGSLWARVASAQRISELAARSPSDESGTPEHVTVGPSDAIVSLSLQWRFDPRSLDSELRSTIADTVVDQSAKSWTLTSAARRRWLAGCSRARLSDLLGTTSDESLEQRVIARLVRDEGVSADSFSDAELPYALQAVGWLSAAIDGLPSVEHLRRRVERRRVRARLARLTSPSFLGRGDELSTMRGWFDGRASRAMTISGIGGMGKSALVARFVEQLPPDALVLWLDFDSPDIAPDDAWSLLDALDQQCRAQLDRWEFRCSDRNERDQSWKLHAAELGRAIDQSSSSRPALLVLDSFEVAQHARRREELWRTLERITTNAPAIRVVVVGRAEVSELPLFASPVDRLPLGRLRPEDERQWLEENGVSDGAARARIASLCNGVPLKLRLAVLLLREGGALDELPANIEERLVEGYLYDRILDRVCSPELRPLARAVLVLRRVTVELLGDVLAPWLPQGVSASEAFELLRRELALVEGGEALRVRAEVRESALALLDRDDPAFVRAVDRRAIAHYSRGRLECLARKDAAGQFSAADEARFAESSAELVYHSLRAGLCSAAESAWKSAAKELGARWGSLADGQLGDAGSTLTTNALAQPDAVSPLAVQASTWLRQRLSQAGAGDKSVEQWESVVAQRIRESNTRGLERGVAEFLAERTERTKNSELHFFDAWVFAREGRFDESRAKIAGIDAEVLRGRLDLRCLAAWVARKQGDRSAATAWLDGAVAVDGVAVSLRRAVIAALGQHLLWFAVDVRAGLDEVLRRSAVFDALAFGGGDASRGFVAPDEAEVLLALDLLRYLATESIPARFGTMDRLRTLLTKARFGALDEARSRIHALAVLDDARSWVAALPVKADGPVFESVEPLLERIFYDQWPFAALFALALLPDPLEQIVNQFAGAMRDA